MNRYWVQVSPQIRQPGRARRCHGLDRLLAGDVDHVQRTVGEVGELDRAAGRLALGVGRPSRGMPLRLGLALGQRLLDQHVDHVAVLGVDHHQRAGLGRDLHDSKQRLVVDHDRALVGHEQLVAGDALVGGLGHVLELAAVVQVGDREVEADVDHRRAALDLLVPGGERVGNRLARSLEAEVDQRGDAAERRRCRARGEVVAGDRPAERHLHVRVRVDRARDHVLARRVDHTIGGDVERPSDLGDRLSLDQDVGHVVVSRGDDVAAFDQHAHGLSS